MHIAKITASAGINFCWMKSRLSISFFMSSLMALFGSVPSRIIVFSLTFSRSLRNCSSADEILPVFSMSARFTTYIHQSLPWYCSATDFSVNVSLPGGGSSIPSVIITITTSLLSLPAFSSVRFFAIAKTCRSMASMCVHCPWASVIDIYFFNISLSF